MSDKLRRAEVIIALDKHRQRMENDLQTTLAPFQDFFTNACDHCGEVKLFADSYSAYIRSQETKLEELL